MQINECYLLVKYFNNVEKFQVRMGIIIVGVNASRAKNLLVAMNPIALFIPVQKMQYNTNEKILVNS